MGRIITDTVKKLWDKASPMETGKIWAKVEMKYVPTNMSGIEHLDEYCDSNSERGQKMREAICEKLAGNDEIWYANNMEICKYVEAYKQLEISATQRIVHNPTATTVWFESDNKQYCVKPGQTIRMEP